MLDKVAGILKKKKKNQRDILLRVVLVRFLLLFKILLFLVVLHNYFLAVDCLFPSCIDSEALHRAIFHFLIGKVSLLSKDVGH